jgi:hypothetical protein
MKYLLPIVLASLFSSNVFGQTTLSFCAAMRDENCIFNNTKFISSPDSSTTEITMLVRNSSGLSTLTLNYKLFVLNGKGEEILLKTIPQTSQAEWIYAWQSNNFKSPGKYKVRVYNDKDEQVCSKSFELFDVW